MDLSVLPKEIIHKIVLYLQCPIARLIKDEIKIYETDHNYCYTKMYNLYYIKNILSFSSYCFDKYMDPFDYDSFQYESMRNYNYIDD
jgi:hypothetical protein